MCEIIFVLDYLELLKEKVRKQYSRLMCQRFHMVIHIHEIVAIDIFGRIAALVRSHMNGLLPFERTIEQTTETMPLGPKTITASAL